MFEADRARIATIGRPAGSALRVHEALQTRPLSTIGRLQRVTGLTPPTILKSLEHLERLGLVHEITGRRRNRVFSYQPYLQELSAGT